MDTAVSSKSELKKHTNNRILSNMSLLLAGKMVSLLGTFIYNFAIGLYVLKVTGSGVSFAATMIFTMLPRILIGPFAGVIVDRLDRKKLVILSDVLSGLVVLALYWISASSGLHLNQIYVASVLLAICNTFFSIGFDSSIPNIVDDQRLLKANSYNESIDAVTRILAPVLGGIIFGFVDIRLFLLINGVSFLISSITEMFIDFNLTSKPSDKSNTPKHKLFSKQIFSDLNEGFTYAKSQKKLFTIMIFALFFNFFIAFGMSVAVPYIINNVIGMNAEKYGIIVGAMPVGMLLSSLLISLIPEAKSKHRVMTVGFYICVALLTLSGVPGITELRHLGVTVFFVTYIAIYFMMGVTTIFINIPIGLTLQRETPNEYRGRVLSLIQTMATAITPLGYVMAGLLIDVIPVYILPFVSGGIMFLLMIKFITNKELKQW